MNRRRNRRVVSPKRLPMEDSAVSFIVDAVMARPGEVTLVAIGPLTNIAQAIRAEPEFAASVKQLVIMGGAVAALPDGAGNITPNAEFKLLGGPGSRACDITFRHSDRVIATERFRASRRLTSVGMKNWCRWIRRSPGCLKETLGRRFESEPDRVWLMYDQIAVASIIDPTLVTSERMYVDVNIDHGISYGVSVGGREPWPGAEDAQAMNVQYGLDWPRFIEMFVERVQR